MKTVGYFTTPRLDELEVQTVRKAFDTNLEWLDNSYPIVHAQDDEDETYPVVYFQDGSWDSIDLRPDDDVDSYCFFESISFEVGDQDDINTYNLSASFWVNLEKMDTAIDEDYTSRLISDVVRVLKLKDAGSITIDYDPFSSFNFAHNLLRRYTGFKVSFVIYGNNNACDFNVT